jgi:hypothetical protein
MSTIGIAGDNAHLAGLASPVCGKLMLQKPDQPN